MTRTLDGQALVYCDGAFNTPNGKTAHGLVRFTERYEVKGIIDHTYSGKDAGQVLDGTPNGIMVYATIDQALETAQDLGWILEYFVIGLAPDGGKLPPKAREVVNKALTKGLNIDSGLHDFLSDDEEISLLAKAQGRQIRDIRKTPPRSSLHFFSGEIEKVDSLVIAVLGTDSAVGKRTTAWLLVHGLRNAGISAELVGTGQTAWMQGARYSFVLDSLINDFVAGEIEHGVVSAWKDGAEVIVIEGQGSLMNPAYPGGFEILAAGRPDCIVLQHAPARKEYDGFPGYPLHPIERQIEALDIIGGKPVVAITINHENLTEVGIKEAAIDLTSRTRLPAFDVLLNGSKPLVDLIIEFRKNHPKPAL